MRVVYDAGPGTPNGAECGDGLLGVLGNEECEDGNTRSLDGCDSNCRGKFCGDAIVNNDETETCDDGNNGSLHGWDPLWRGDIIRSESWLETRRDCDFMDDGLMNGSCPQ